MKATPYLYYSELTQTFLHREGCAEASKQYHSRSTPPNGLAEWRATMVEEALHTRPTACCERSVVAAVHLHEDERLPTEALISTKRREDAYVSHESRAA